MFQLFGNAVGQVAMVSILIGAGLPALFAVGVRVLAASEGRRSYRIAAYAIFALVVMVVLLGIALIVANGLGVTLGE